MEERHKPSILTRPTCDLHAGLKPSYARLQCDIEITLSQKSPDGERMTAQVITKQPLDNATSNTITMAGTRCD
jgi:hypothetical protein